MVPIKVSKIWVNFVHHYKHKIFGCLPYTLRFWRNKYVSKDIFRTPSNIYDGAFLKKIINIDRVCNLLSANPIKSSDTLKQFVGKLPTNCLNVLDILWGC